MIDTASDCLWRAVRHCLCHLLAPVTHQKVNKVWVGKLSWTAELWAFIALTVNTCLHKTHRETFSTAVDVHRTAGSAEETSKLIWATAIPSSLSLIFILFLTPSLLDHLPVSRQLIYLNFDVSEMSNQSLISLSCMQHSFTHTHCRNKSRIMWGVGATYSLSKQRT